MSSIKTTVMKLPSTSFRHRWSPRKGAFREVIWAALLTLLAQYAQAGSGTSISLPLAHVKARSGLRLEVDTRWVDGNGYRPVRVRIYPVRGGNAVADRRLEVALTPNGWPSGRQGTTVAAVVDLEQGNPWGEVVVPIPSSEAWVSIGVSTHEGGRSLSDLSATRLHLAPRNYYEWNDGSPSILFVDRDVHHFGTSVTARRAADPNELVLPDYRALASLMPVNFYNGTVANNLTRLSEVTTNSQLLQMLADLPRLDILPPQALPTDWVALTGIDFIFVSLEDLHAWRQSYAPQWEAVRRWLSTGTALCVYGVGTRFERLDELERLLEVPQISSEQFRGWQMPDASAFGKPAIDPRLLADQGIAVPLNDTPSAPTPNAPVEAPFLHRAVEQGQLVAFSSDDPFPGDKKLWNWMLYSIGAENWTWCMRHGLSLQRENNDYWNLLIPGVGEAPVNSFLVLISLFVIVIGPVNYYWLRKKERLYLLLITVPLGAICVTAGLLLYALVTDGIGVQSRVRSISHFDQRTDRAVTWSRQSYYAGITPSTGLVFPTDAAVIPVDFRPRQLAATNRSRQIEWRDEQRLFGGYFPSRATVQYAVVESRLASEELEFGAVSVNDQLPVTNRLGVDVHRLVVCDSDGHYFGGRQLSVGASQDLATIDPQDELRFWSRLMAEHRPRYPEGFDPYQIENATRFFGSYMNLGTQGLAKPTFADSVMERRLLVANDLAKLQPRNYIALVERGPQLSLGKSAAKRTEFHIVLGTW